MDTVDLEEMGLIDGSSTIISDIVDSQPILYTQDGTISINSEYLSSNGNRVTYVTIPNLVQIVQDANLSHIGYLINNNQFRINQPIILDEDNCTDVSENSADDNSEGFLKNQISDCWITPNDSQSAPVATHKEEINHDNVGKLPIVASSSKEMRKFATSNEDVEPPDKAGSLFCEQCGLEFSSCILFRRHKVKHLYEKPFKCNFCRESFNYENNLILHLATHNRENPFCPVCKKKFNRIAGLKAHMLLHEQEESLFCNECGEEFSCTVYLQEHMREHRECKVVPSEPKTRKFFKCNCCNAVFNSFSERKDHLKKFHKAERNRRLRNYGYNNMRRRGNNVCEYCKKCFEKPSQLLRHKRIHTGERPFKCELCSRAFSQKGSLQIHMFKHTRERPYVCQFCKGTFSQKGNLKAHIKRLHFIADDDERNFKCKVCSCVFRKRGSLNAHFTKFHAFGQQGSFVRNEEKQKPISAEQCNYKANTDSSDSSNKENEVIKSGGTKKVLFSTTCALKDGKIQEINVVQRNVESTKLHRCSYCSKEFQRSSDLISHIRMHTQEKPFKCKICFKSFAWNSNLAGHLKVHSGIKSHCCSICSKTFSTSSSLKLHKNKHLINGELSSEDLGEIKIVTPKKTDTCDTLEETSQIEEINQPSVYIDQIDVPSINGNVLLTENGSIVDISSELEDEERENNETMDNISMQCEESDFSFKKISYLKANRQNQNGEIHYKCKFCPCTFTKPKTLKKHMEIHSSLGKYVCEHCGKIFPSETALKSHSGVHISGFPWACPVCGSGFKSYAACRRHLAVHPKFGPIKYKPMAVESNEENKFAEISNETPVTFQPEQVNEHKNQNGLPSDLKDLISFLQPGQHVTITEDGGFAFPTVTSEGQVDGQFTIIDEKNISNSSASSSQKQIFDSSLENCIFLQQGLDIEASVIGTDINTLIPQMQTLEKCDVSSMVFANETDFTVHKAIHIQEKPHTCLTCDKSFISAVEYEEHMKFHLKEDPAPSVVVEGSVSEKISTISAIQPQAVLFRNPSDKKKTKPPWKPPARRLTDEETKVLSAIDSNTASISEKVLLQSLLEKEKYEHPVKEEPKTPEKHQHKCKYCPKSFKKPSDLIRHLRTHTGERPFECTSCHKRFSIKSTASSHMKTHTKDRSFSCFICSKNFATTGSLKIHMRLHTGLKPFSCHLCDAKFRTSGHKKAHLKKHLKESVNGSKEGQSNRRKSNDMEGHFLENLLEQSEYLNPLKSSTSTNNATVPVGGTEGSPYLVPLNTQSVVTSVTEGDKKSLSDYLINLDDSGTSAVESTRYLLSVKDIVDNDESFIVEKLNDDQIIVTITKGNTTILANPNDSISTTNQVELVTEEKFSCSFCKKLFSKQSTLYKHVQKYHTETFQCVVCAEKFERKSDLEFHSLAHELEKAFTCSDCTESFSLEEDFRTHKCNKAESLDLAYDHDLFLFPPV